MSNHKRKWIRGLKVGLLLLPVALFFLFFPVNDLEDVRRVEDFFLEEPHSLDVVFLGASDVYAGFSPTLAYEEFGFTSYDYCPSGNYLHYLPGQIRDVLRVQSPQLLVIDIAEVSLDKGTPHDTIFRKYITGTPLSRNKIELIRKYADKDHLLSYYLPFCTNHGNTDIASIAEMALTRFKTDLRGYSLLKGSMTYTAFEQNPNRDFDPRNTANDLSAAEIPPVIDSNIHYLLSYCKENVAAPILFVNFPRRVTTEETYLHHQVINAIGEVIDGYGYDFINLQTKTDAIGLDADRDFFNDEHMNLYGQYKTTRYLSKILTEDYGIRGGTLSDTARMQWDTCAAYQHVYYDVFESALQSGDFDLWMKEDIHLLRRLEERKP